MASTFHPASVLFAIAVRSISHPSSTWALQQGRRGVAGGRVHWRMFMQHMPAGPECCRAGAHVLEIAQRSQAALVQHVATHSSVAVVSLFATKALY